MNILEILTVNFLIIEENHMFNNVPIFRNLSIQTVGIFFSFLTVFDLSKKYALFHNNHTLELAFTKNRPVLFMKGLILLDVKQCGAIKHKG